MMASDERRLEGKRKSRGAHGVPGAQRNCSLEGHSGGQWVCLEGKQEGLFCWEEMLKKRKQGGQGDSNWA